MTEAQPFFSVVIPTRSRAGFLRTCIDNLLQQTFTDFELVVSDNCSKDETPEVVASFKDPRIRYVRQTQDLDALQSFRAATGLARGKYLVLNQDDDLLHRDFLLRCHQGVTSEPGITGYVSAWWRGDVGAGFSSELLPDPITRSHHWLMQDRQLVLDGRYLASTLLYTYSFVHPAIAFELHTFRDIGGYQAPFAGIFDLVAEASVFCRGKVVLDPRPLALYREHTTNFSHHMKRADKREGKRALYGYIIDLLDQSGFDWQKSGAADLAAMSEGKLIWVLRNLVRNSAPPQLQSLMRTELERRFCGQKTSIWRMLISKIGLKRAMKFYLATRG
jgi:glycosyltransferase involved in cell wall biosynthesis